MITDRRLLASSVRARSWREAVSASASVGTSATASRRGRQLDVPERRERGAAALAADAASARRACRRRRCRRAGGEEVVPMSCTAMNSGSRWSICCCSASAARRRRTARARWRHRFADVLLGSASSPARRMTQWSRAPFAPGWPRQAPGNGRRRRAGSWSSWFSGLFDVLRRSVSVFGMPAPLFHRGGGTWMSSQWRCASPPRGAAGASMMHDPSAYPP